MDSFSSITYNCSSQELAWVVSQCFTKAVDVGLVPMEEAVDCAVHCTGKCVCLSAVSGGACQPCAICNPLLVVGKGNMHLL
eukprot:10281176-Ditylum_brightwellii.AAC.1